LSLPDYSLRRLTVLLPGALGEEEVVEAFMVAADFTEAGAFMVAADFTEAEAFMVAADFTAGGDSQAFTVRADSAAFVAVEASMAGVGSQAFTGAILGAFTAIAVFSAVIVFSFPVFMGTRGGGIGVIPIIGGTHIIGVIRTTHTIRITRISLIHPGHTTVTMRTAAIRISEQLMPALPRCDVTYGLIGLDNVQIKGCV
jgi:hypothetical protein